MNWDIAYVVTRSLTLEVAPTGNLVVVGSLSRKPQVMDLDALPVLLGFASGALPREVLHRLRQDWEIEENGFGEVVGALIEENLLQPVDTQEEKPSLPERAFGSVRGHFNMLKDPVRVLSYRSAIERQAKGLTVVEIGCGTGILSLFAARAGARKVIAIEESAIAQTAAKMFAANGAADSIELRVTNSRNVELDEPADLIIHEILGVDPFEEKLLPVLDDARRRLLKPGGRLLPYRLEVCCMGVERDDPAADGERILAEAGEFSGLYGLDFRPFLDDLGESVVPMATRTWIGGKTSFDPVILSEESRFLDLDFRTDPLDLTGWAAKVPLRIIREGTLAGAVLFFRAHLDEQIQLTTSPLAPVTSWGWDIRLFSRQVAVAPGDEVSLTVELRHRAGAQSLTVDLA
ncbi:MAG TPA: 50S ribosomal protein L11 methyltransferase [Thermoanaerobaculia bacterium]|nr:50S ribosomal protein L11 methyltransferase [Thermoanaerobaculia bacterium]